MCALCASARARSSLAVCAVTGVSSYPHPALSASLQESAEITESKPAPCRDMLHRRFEAAGVDLLRSHRRPRRSRRRGRRTGSPGPRRLVLGFVSIVESAASAARPRNAAGCPRRRRGRRGRRRCTARTSACSATVPSAHQLAPAPEHLVAGFQVIGGEAGVHVVTLQQREPQRQRVQPAEVRDRWPDLTGPHPVRRGARGARLPGRPPRRAVPAGRP